MKPNKRPSTASIWSFPKIKRLCQFKTRLPKSSELASNVNLTFFIFFKLQRTTMAVAFRQHRSKRESVFLPENEVFGLLWNRHFWRKDQRFSPVHHFSVGFLRRLWAEWRVTCSSRQQPQRLRQRLKPEPATPDGHVLIFTYQHLVHDDTEAPPIAELVVSVLHKDLWGDVVWGPHGGECLKLGKEKVQENPPWCGISSEKCQSLQTWKHFLNTPLL